MKNLKVTSKKDGVVFASNPSGSVKVSLHGLRKPDYRRMVRGNSIKELQ